MARIALVLQLFEEAARDEVRRERRKKARRKLRNAKANLLIEHTIQIDDEEFINKYGLSQSLFNSLVEQLAPILKKEMRSTDLSIKSKILVTLSFYATGGYQNSNSNYMSQQSTLKSIKEVTEALNHPAILNAHNKFPVSIEERNLIKAKFKEEYHMSGVIGCVKGTRLTMTRPKEYDGHYLNGTQYTKNAQIICDYDLNIICLDATHGGTTDEAFIFDNQDLKIHLENLTDQGENVCLLGDSKFPQRKYMMTPIEIAPSGSAEEQYNKMHASAIQRAERTVCLLKARWQCLTKVLHYHPDVVTKIINACCLLHNICNRAQMAAPSNLHETRIALAHMHTYSTLPTGSFISTEQELQSGLEARKHIVNMMSQGK